MVLHDSFHHSAIISCITFHIWKSVDSETFNKVYRGILRFLSVDRNTRFIEGWTVLRETIVLLRVSLNEFFTLSALCPLVNALTKKFRFLIVYSSAKNTVPRPHVIGYWIVTLHLNSYLVGILKKQSTY